MLYIRPPHSAIRDHSYDKCEPAVDISKFKILNSANHKTDIRILESLYINRLKPDLNIAGSHSTLFFV